MGDLFFDGSQFLFQLVLIIRKRFQLFLLAVEPTLEAMTLAATAVIVVSTAATVIAESLVVTASAIHVNTSFPFENY